MSLPITVIAFLALARGGGPTVPTMRLTKLGATVPPKLRDWFRAQANLTIAGGAFTAPSYDRQSSNSTRNTSCYCPDNGSDPRMNYDEGTYVRDFTYTFSMAPNLVPAEDIGNALDYFISGYVRACARARACEVTSPVAWTVRTTHFVSSTF